jgi:hypothetical protein
MMAIIGCNGYNDMKTNKRWDDGFMNPGWPCLPSKARMLCLDSL